MRGIGFRYIVDDVGEAVAFYSKRLGFVVDMHPAPGFARLSSGGTHLLLNAAGGKGGASRAMPDGARPEPGGWNRIQITVDDLDEIVASLRAAGVTFRNDVVEGMGGRQILLEDPSGNPVELFEPKP